jgi:hypothetical protein
MTRSYLSRLVLGFAILVGPALLVGCEGGDTAPANPPTNSLPAGTAPGGPKDAMPKGDTAKEPVSAAPAK